MSYSINRIDKAFDGAVHLKASDHRGFVIFSDCHRGCGTWADNFMSNRPLYIAALQYYLQKDFTYIELGDGDELWENRKFSEIYNTHIDVFNIFTEFARRDHLYLVFGNHDRVMKKDGRIESLIIDTESKPLYLFHGYQGDLLNDSFWKLSRWLVRYLWKPLELHGVRNPTSAAKNITKLKKAEERYMKFSCENDCILVAGHTHRPTLSIDSDCGIYFNSGSCIHPNAITSIELENNEATLIKWELCARQDMSLYICRKILAGPIDIAKFPD